MGLMHQMYDCKYSQKSRLSCSGSPAMGQGRTRSAEAPPGQVSRRQGSTAAGPVTSTPRARRTTGPTRRSVPL